MSPKPIFALHGFAGGPAMWDPLREGSARRWVRARLPGHGAEPATRDFEHAVEHLHAEAEEQGLRGACLLGYSMGARLGLGLLLRDPLFFGSAILVGANPGIPESERAARRAWERTWAETLRAEGLETFYESWDGQALLTPARPLSSRARDAREASRRDHESEGLAWAMVELGLGAMPDYRARLAEIDLPVTLVVGSEDTKFLALAREMVSSMQRARLVVVPDAGHNVVLEQPEALAALLGAEHEQ